MLVEVVEARPLEGHRLWIRFDDGTEGEVDVAALVSFTGVFEPLRDPAKFAEVVVDSELKTVCWPGGADLDPQVLHEAVTGKRIEFAKPVLAGS